MLYSLFMGLFLSKSYYRACSTNNMNLFNMQPISEDYFPPFTEGIRMKTTTHSGTLGLLLNPPPKGTIQKHLKAWYKPILKDNFPFAPLPLQTEEESGS